MQRVGLGKHVWQWQCLFNHIGNVALVLRSPSAFVSNLDFTPAQGFLVVGLGGSLLAGFTTGVVTVWNISNQQPIAILSDHTTAIQSIHFHFYEPLLAVNSKDDQVTVYHLFWYASTIYKVSFAEQAHLAFLDCILSYLTAHAINVAFRWTMHMLQQANWWVRIAYSYSYM